MFVGDRERACVVSGLNTAEVFFQSVHLKNTSGEIQK